MFKAGDQVAVRVGSQVVRGTVAGWSRSQRAWVVRPDGGVDVRTGHAVLAQASDIFPRYRP